MLHVSQPVKDCRIDGEWQPREPDVANQPLLLQFLQSWQGLLDDLQHRNLITLSCFERLGSLLLKLLLCNCCNMHLCCNSSQYLVQLDKFNVVAVHQIQVRQLQAVQALSDGLFHPLGTEVKGVLTIAANLAGHIDLVARQAFEAPAKHLCIMATP